MAERKIEHEGRIFGILSESVDALGEVPTWRAEENAVYWIDVRKPCLYRLDCETSEKREWPMPETIGTYVFREDGRILVGLQSGIGVFDPASDVVEMLETPYSDLPHMRFNDGHCDRQGRLWIGTMDNLKRGADGVLFRRDDRGLMQVADQVVVPNSLCWSPDGRVMYFSDGREPVIWAFDLDIETGEIGNRRIFARMASGGVPDGATVDADGFLWSTQYGAHRIDVFSPDGVLHEAISVPVKQPTCVAFGGPEMKTLFITTARQNMSEAELLGDPLAGALLTLDTDVAGIPEVPYRF